MLLQYRQQSLQHQPQLLSPHQSLQKSPRLHLQKRHQSFRSPKLQQVPTQSRHRLLLHLLQHLLPKAREATLRQQPMRLRPHLVPSALLASRSRLLRVAQ